MLRAQRSQALGQFAILGGFAAVAIMQRRLGRILAGNHGAQHALDFTDAAALGDEACSAIGQRTAHDQRIIIGRNHDHGDCRKFAAQTDQAHQAMTAGHVQVEQDQIDIGVPAQYLARRIKTIGLDDFDLVEIADGLH